MFCVAKVGAMEGGLGELMMWDRRLRVENIAGGGWHLRLGWLVVMICDLGMCWARGAFLVG